jgi:hypothetical protein
MSLLIRSVIAVVVIMQWMPLAAAHDLVCADVACLPLQPPVHRPPGNFHPTLRDGVPMEEDFQHAPEGYYGIACQWAWRRVATPTGLTWGLARDCLSY